MPSGFATGVLGRLRNALSAGRATSEPAPASPLPAADEVEVVVLGPGYGESVLVHVGERRWLIVDSCRESDGEPAALSYLRQVGENPAECVVALLLTHYHDDHMSGFAEQVRACPNAVVYLPSVMRSSVFAAAVNTRDDPVDGLLEITDTWRQLCTLDGRTRRPWRLADEDRLVVPDGGWPEAANVEAWALSPSSADLRLAHLDLLKHLPPGGRRSSGLPAPESNHTSVVLHVRVGRQTVLLAGDREELASRWRGWASAHASHRRLRLEKARVYKVAHHGAPNGDADVIWSRLLQPDPWTVVAPFNRGLKGGRPRFEDVQALRRRTRRLWATSEVATSSAVSDPMKERVVDVDGDALLGLFGIEVEDAQPPLGYVRLRAPAGGGDWTVHLSRQATDLCGGPT